MKKIIPTLIVSMALAAGGCMESAMNTASNTNRTNIYPASPPPTPAATNQADSSNIQKNVNWSANITREEYDKDRADYPQKPTGSSSNSGTATTTNGSSSNSGTTTSSNAQTSNAQMPNNPTPTPQTVEKKDEGLFSFPPPKVTSYSVIDNAALLNREGQTTFSQVSEKLAAALNRAGYANNKYSYFWNEKDEFAVVTAMERINPDGSPLSDFARWNDSVNLPRARIGTNYFKYLISGKKVYYRVLAFVVTAKRTGSSFRKNTPPDFTMAGNWMNKGESELGGGESPTIEDAPFTEKYKCFALLYIFVNHTSLEAPKSIDALTETEEGLRDGVNLETEAHLRATNINFGG